MIMAVSIADGTDKKCYGCPNPIEGATTEWVDYQGKNKIYLHPRCAILMANRLINDAILADPNLDRQNIVELIQTKVAING
jgi:hypothetical protein